MNVDNRIQEIVGRGIVYRGNEVDTDAIVPARFLKEVTFSRMGEFVFYDQRFDKNGKPKAHPFNDEKFQGASVLLVNQNFGCGSSREHAPQALMRWGIKAIVGESFAKIFAGNCGSLGIPAVSVNSETIIFLMDLTEGKPGTIFRIDLGSCRVSYEQGDKKKFFSFGIAQSTLQALVSGKWNSTMMLKAHEKKVREVASSLPYVRNFKT